MRVRFLTAAGRIMLALSEGEGGLTFGEIVDKTGLSTVTVSLNLQKLVAEGLVRKEGRFYVLTPTGRRAVEELRALVAPEARG